jgi:thiamine pyrophosphokinase
MIPSSDYQNLEFDRSKVLGVLGGHDMPLELLQMWLESASVVLAADFGADVVMSADKLADFVVGDLDSISPEAIEAHARVIQDPDQDTTDCDKLLSLARELGISSITLTNVEGDRFDHMIGTVASAIRSNLDVRLALRQGIGWVLRPNQAIEVATMPGSGVALLPMMPTRGAVLDGVVWTLSNAEMSFDGLVSVANRAEKETVRARIESGAALLIVEFPTAQLPIW